MSTPYPIVRDGIIVSQPFGEFFVTSLPARILLEVAYSEGLLTGNGALKGLTMLMQAMGEDKRLTGKSTGGW